ncbi:hypothetical protein DPMN_135627 [Dreissena polymorpha]|uniref:Uncharacterized protein n=1 Tax=Dreissena polymorpha TaxID=45954 RepID=A0A9D4JH21_DREPO|nr:hypothetical protein DPMN_135627 [Dreissena polymorpha]
MKTKTSTVYTNKMLTDTRTHIRKPDIQGHISSTRHFVTGKNARPPGGHAFQPTKTIFIQDIIMMNLVIKVYEDRTINVASRVLTRKNAPPPGGNQYNEKKSAPPPFGGHIFQPTGTVFKLIKDIIGPNLLTKFHEDLTINKTMHRQLVAMTNIKTKFHYDLKLIVAPRVLSRKNAPPPSGGNVFQPTGIFF